MNCNFISGQLQTFTRDCAFSEHRLKKGERIETTDGEIPLPEAMIQHIQSFMSGREAAGTTILSKSWYNAWLTRPVLDFDIRYFRSQQVFEEFAKKTMQRYQKLSLKIDSFRLCNNGKYCCGRDRHAHDLIVGALKMGATTVQLERCSFALPQEVLRSETPIELSLIWCRVDGNNAISCSRLRSLTLEGVQIKSGEDFFKGLISCCTLLEELSLSNRYDLDLEWTDPFELHKLRRLFLQSVFLDSTFYANISSRFPSLKDLSIVQCFGSDVRLASNSLETICLQTDKVSKAAKFDVPNIRKFTYSCMGLPSQLSIKGPSREWEFDITIVSNHFHKISWFITLKGLLKKFKLSRISLCIDLCYMNGRPRVDVEVARKPLVVESLTIDAPSMLSTALVVRSLGVFRPKFMTHRDCNIYAWMQDDKVNSIIHILRKRLIQALFASNWQAMFGKFGLKKVNVEIYDKFDAKWRPLRLKKAEADPKAKVRLQLIWNN